ncbi:MAG: helix-turn-helix domain-containing protein [Xenococcaceae cyanobacterium MO_167.B52]|nr:helix-turn-helix domain-containing protein [Xenococcaceae cyanobacterium MO_167.B52]
MITFTHRYKIKPTKQQVKQFEQYLDICRGVYNYAHAERKAWLESSMLILVLSDHQISQATLLEKK